MVPWYQLIWECEGLTTMLIIYGVLGLLGLLAGIGSHLGWDRPPYTQNGPPPPRIQKLRESFRKERKKQ